MKKALFDYAFQIKLANFNQYGSVIHPFWDDILFSKIREKLGGRVRLMLTGSAPISIDVMNFLRICFSCHVTEGYGQTEGCAMVCEIILFSSTLHLPSPFFSTLIFHPSFLFIILPSHSHLLTLGDCYALRRQRKRHSRPAHGISRN
jgi:acyl-CoA synthetase (AMP-forming)/AMP-acid ligase II